MMISSESYVFINQTFKKTFLKDGCMIFKRFLRFKDSNSMENLRCKHEAHQFDVIYYERS